MQRVSVHRFRPGELEGRQTGRMRELEEDWNGRDLPWRSSLPNLNRLRSQSICYLEAVIMPGFCQHCSAVGDCILRDGGGAPVELLTDNATTFSGYTFSKLAECWGIRMRFRCAFYCTVRSLHNPVDSRCIHTGCQQDCGEISPYNKTHCHKNMVLGNGGCILVQCDSQKRCVGFNRTSKHDILVYSPYKRY